MTSTITIRTDSDLKERATELFDSLGMNLSVAINVFLRQAVNHRRFPCSIEAPEEISDASKTYPADFFSLFGCASNDEIFIEPEDLPLEQEDFAL